MFRLPKSISKVRYLSFRNPYEAETGSINKPQLLELSESALRQKDYFGVEKMVTIKELFENRVHIGHRSGKVHSEMNKYILGTMDGISIIDLDKTLPRMRQALNFVSHVVYRNGIILFVNERPHFTRVTQETARECGEYFATRWVPGTFSNYGTYLKTAPFPDAIIVFNCILSEILIKEAQSCGIPVIAICDSDSNPDNTMYPIPGNDDTSQTVVYYKDLFKRAVIQAKIKRNQDFIRHDNTLN
ncbi:hypothetical protein LOD99_1901 [Oopsacas minuta]|uniref:Mitochondrial ribosomal protein S2 n=1 Tax=Oopsacas minuta TaxID=111878 RepID=A0AAV7K5L9_9METZ|nr:hypothetical protein LOD99_1901 [Oopsacas minuta]